ncbi:protein-glutamate methylesterase/protein-glutamine glutaminase [Pleionea mediterranea]|uniref:Protein-glutamate methylesterase/protein-glutamine glutaminase n=1 Tax=Pleionea mediterranea TaxID=523701 RepID=A0A316G3Z5_9GAMM|nr:chemotaxis response regulator protein-glutamate methylesterase [Pleionea mediterranea]PWK49127.1 two-component system chemotaxis response regulator CheB [Pleionea mediterranea]
MTIRVLVVDDSNFFCRRVAQILSSDPQIKVIGVANNGQEAIQKVQQLKPDVITLDVEMPVMDGITALKQIMQLQPTKALMLSSLTYEGAKLTLDALDAGAADFMLKSYEGISQSSGQLANLLREKVKEIGLKGKVVATKTATTPVQQPSAPVSNSRGQFKLLAIGASTGGPVAIQKFLTSLPANFSLPITITQHMPGTFTGAFAQRMNSLSKLDVMEAENGVLLKPGKVYIAPGGKQMLIEGTSGHPKIRIKDTDARLQYAPCVDLTYGSAAKVFGRQVLAIVLTGMGADGREGARILKQSGAKVWTQDEASCVVYGMPMSVAKAGFSDNEFSADNLASQVLQVV